MATTSNIGLTLLNSGSTIYASTLNTNFNTIDSQIASLKSSVSNGKSTIASAITNKGVSTSSSASWSTMATNIGKLVAPSGHVEYTTGGSYSDVVNATGLTTDPNTSKKFSSWMGKYQVFAILNPFSTGSGTVYMNSGSCFYQPASKSWAVGIQMNNVYCDTDNQAYITMTERTINGIRCIIGNLPSADGEYTYLGPRQWCIIKVFS